VTLDTRPPLSPRVLERVRVERAHPTRFQPDYMMLRFLRERIVYALSRIDTPVTSVLDVWAGTRPYRELLPPHETYVSIDLDEHFGPQDVVSKEFLPFADQAFDLIMFTEGFYYLADPAAGAAELRRVLRPGGHALITVPYAWEYDTAAIEHRYTRMTLYRVFEPEWEEIWVGENGGYAAAWATVTGRVLRGVHEFGPAGRRRLTGPLLPLAYRAVNAVGLRLEQFEEQNFTGPYAMPAGITLIARRPPED
jgi:SAM-dependent methyltransferase